MTARRRFAQHFLHPSWAARLLDAIDTRPDDRILEIGPGRGALTVPLAARVAHITAVEIDWDLAAELSSKVPPNVSVVQGDILKVDLAALRTSGRDPQIDHQVPKSPDTKSPNPELSKSPNATWRVVGNLPYNITSPILFRLLALHRDDGGVSDATLMMQQEVAARLVARPGTGDYGVLGILVSLDADVRHLFTLPPSAFRPAPKVTSAVVRLTFRPPPVAVRDRATLERLVRQIFTQRRKTLLNALKPFAAGSAVTAAEAISQAGLDPGARPETLQLFQLATLADVFSAPPQAAVL